MGLVAPRIVHFTELERWDVKFFLCQIKSNYPLVSLSELVTEHNEKIRPYDEPKTTFKILGVNNTDGIFHAYDAKGKSIKQPYKIVNTGDFAYNPYRINVGSIGLVPKEHDRAYISPAYVVFSIDESIIYPELFWFIIKSDFYNKTLRAATAGSVRMNLTYPLLQTLKIPMPPFSIQKKIVSFWKDKKLESVKLLNNANQLHESIENIILKQLGLEKKKQKQRPKVMISSWGEMVKWNQRATYLINQMPDLSNGKFPVVNGKECMSEVKHGCPASPSNKHSPLRVLKLSAVTSGIFLPDEAKYIADRKRFRESFDIKAGDILLCRTNGTLSYVGRSVYIERNYNNLIFPDKLMRLRCKDNISPKYLSYLLRTSIIRPQIEAHARTAVGNYAIGNEDVYNLKLPFPPAKVQQTLIAKINEVEAEISRLNTEAEKILKKAEASMEQIVLGLQTLENI